MKKEDYEDYYEGYLNDITKDKNNKKEEERKKVKFGIDIGASEIMILLVLFRFLNENNYRSNCEVPYRYESRSEGFKYVGKPLKIRFKAIDLFKFYGLSSMKGRGRMNVKEKLLELHNKKKFLFYYSKFMSAKDKEKSTIRHVAGLFNEVQSYSHMGSEYIEIDFNPIFHDQVDKYFFWLPADFLERLIKLNQKGKKKIKISKHELIFFIFLFSQLSIKRQLEKDLAIKTNVLKLAYQLRMYADIRRKNWKVIRRKISGYINDAIKLDYISEVEYNTAETVTKNGNHDPNQLVKNNSIEGITLYLNLHSVFREENKSK